MKKLKCIIGIVVCLFGNLTIKAQNPAIYVYPVNQCTSGAISTATSEITLNMPGALYYTWSVTPSSGMTATCVGSPFNSAPAYTMASITLSGCGAYTVNCTGFTTGNQFMYTINRTGTITCAPIPTLTFYNSAANTSVCPGTQITLSVSGVNTHTLDYHPFWSLLLSYSHSPGYTLNPLQTTCWNVCGTGTAGCTTPLYTTCVNVIPIPTLSISGSTLICSGTNATLQASGASSYTWNGSVMAPSISVSPTLNTSYSVAGNNGTCTPSSTIITVTVSPTPTVNVVSSQSKICSGDSAILSASGALSYLWSSSQITSSITVSPASNSVYTVTGESGSCSDTKTIGIVVDPGPALSITNSTICIGETSVLSASGAVTYTWASYPGQQPVVSPIATTVYTVTGANSDGCVTEGTKTLTVNDCVKIAPYENDYFFMYPNPASTDLKISSAVKTSYRIYSVNGQELLNGEFTNELIINLRDFSPGMYTIIFTGNSKKSYKKMLVER